tara:strand:- start:8267 stop:8710 length:444 start_codon:yes stop_codon:yes gene_type:complete
MSATVGFQVGKLIFHYLSTANSVTGVNGMSASQIQPAPLLRKANVNAAVVYEINSVNPVPVKADNTNAYRRMPVLYNVTFTVECVHKVYHDSIYLADAVAQALMKQTYETENNVTHNGFILDSMQETYDKERRMYSKLLTFDVRILL